MESIWIKEIKADRNCVTYHLDVSEGLVRYFSPGCEMFAEFGFRFLYKGIIIKHNKTEPTYTKTSLFLCEKRRFLWPGLRKEWWQPYNLKKKGGSFFVSQAERSGFFSFQNKEVSEWQMTN